MPRKGARVRIAEGIYRDAAGLSAVVNVGSVPDRLTREQRWPPDTTLKTIRGWQTETRAELAKQAKTGGGGPARGRLEDEATIYLEQKAAELVSIKDRTRDLLAWMPRFGKRRRSSLKTRELDAQLRDWRKTLSASSCNHRRDALSDLFIVLDGAEAHNPVKGCVWFKRPPAVPKGIDRGRIARVLEAMPDRTRTKWRLLLMHWSGMRPSQMARLRDTGEDFFLGDQAFRLEVDGVTVRVPAIQVPAGKGGKAVMMPLTPEGERVAGEFLRTQAFGKWSCPSAYKRIVETAKTLRDDQGEPVPSFTVYTIKHSFATALRRTGTDLADIQDMLGHADMASTRIYAPTVNAKHIQALNRLRRDDARRYDEGPRGPSHLRAVPRAEDAADGTRAG